MGNSISYWEVDVKVLCLENVFLRLRIGSLTCRRDWDFIFFWEANIPARLEFYFFAITYWEVDVKV